jgi:2-oxo-3-hexenedioate decarboxylase
MPALDGPVRMACPTEADPGFGLDRAYAVAAEVAALRMARGECPVGRKIGFSNTRIWDEYGVRAPIWGWIWDSTLHPGARELPIAHLSEPRIEPELVLRLGRAPEPGMDLAALETCVEAIAAGFELVQSVYPGWRFRAADTVAAFGLHGALVHGPFVPAAAGWRGALGDFRVTLLRDGVEADRGDATNVLGAGPLAALRDLVALLAAQPGAPALAPGEIVSTGTLTRALPVARDETWTARFDGLPGISGLSLSLA